MVKTGISSACLYPMETEKAVTTLGELGVKYLEVFLNADGEMRPPFAKELRRRADHYGMEVLSVHPFTSGVEPFLFFSNYPRRFEDGRDYYKRYYEAANLLGARYVVFHGGPVGFYGGMEEYCRRFDRLHQDSLEAGVELVHENVVRFAGAQPEFFTELCRLVPNAGTVLDVKQALRAGREIPEMAEAMAGHIRHIHISDHDDRRDCLPLGDGTLDLPAFLELIRRLQPDRYPSIVMEVYRTSFTDPARLGDCDRLLRESFTKNI